LNQESCHHQGLILLSQERRAKSTTGTLQYWFQHPIDEQPCQSNTLFVTRSFRRNGELQQAEEGNGDALPHLVAMTTDATGALTQYEQNKMNNGKRQMQLQR